MIEFRDISKHFRFKNTAVHALDHVSLTIEQGEIYGIVGFSGAGKSTLLRMINGLEKPDSGQIIVEGKVLNNLGKKELRNLRKSIGMVFQQFNLLQSKTVYDNIAMPLILNKEKSDKIDKRVKELADFVGLSDKMEAYPDQLSGGQKQRVGIARALAMNPGILLCDEATSALDPKTTDAILELLKKINEEFNITIVIITHEMHVIGKLCDKVAVMDAGTIIESGDVREVFSNPKETVTKDFVQMVVKETVPEEILDILTSSEGTGQFWSIKYWGENHTIDIIKSLKKDLKCEVQIVYSSTNLLQKYILNVLNVMIKEDRDVSETVTRVLNQYGAIAERKDYTC